MILRKPYAFLIKHFRLLHAIITICMVYLTYRTYKIYSYLSDYIRSGSLKVEKVDIDLIFNKTMFILPIVILLVLLILLIVMIRKHKPKSVQKSALCLNLTTPNSPRTVIPCD